MSDLSDLLSPQPLPTTPDSLHNWGGWEGLRANEESS